MAQECEGLKDCGFFKKYQATQSLACRGYIDRYCKGPEMAQCKRREHKRKHGVPPSDDMLPSGHMIG
jgi:hypothetical protein